jgi:uncharacterized damage-inducible protein DinB
MKLRQGLSGIALTLALSPRGAHKRRTEVVTETIQVHVLTAEDLLKNWQGHRKLTRRTIEAFPEDQLFQFSVGGLRPFAEMAWEFIRMAVPITEGVATGKWEEYQGPQPTTKSELLRLWDQQTTELNDKFGQIPPHRFSEIDKAFGKWEGPGIAALQYAIDNEIHHRGQAYVYLRAIGIEPPPFWERD